VTHDGWSAIRYYYDARNRRVRRGEDWTARLELYGLGGELLGVYGPSTSWPVLLEERMYFAGRLVEHYNPRAYPWQSPTRDRLGSRPVARRYPFGEGNNADNDEFATYRRDATAQHYYAWHRFYSATWGRFSSPDPYVMSGGLTNPQGWNRYSYVANDPVNYYDPQGLARYIPPIWPTPPFTFSITRTELLPKPERATAGIPGIGGHSEGMETVADLEAPPEAGGDAGGNATALRDRDLLPAAFERALEALRNPDCRGLFGNERTRAKGFDPSAVLSSIVSGGRFGEIKFENKGGKWGVASTTPAGRFPIPALAGRVTSTINSYDDTNTYWNDGMTDENAKTLLHELGHAFNFLRGAGGFAISNLKEIRDPYVFDKLIEDRCFRKP
jgi:RHS repeat-associated protein